MVTEAITGKSKKSSSNIWDNNSSKIEQCMWFIIRAQHKGQRYSKKCSISMLKVIDEHKGKRKMGYSVWNTWVNW